MQINSNKKEYLTDRVLQYLDFKRVTKYKFCKDLGFSNGFLDKSREITTDKYAKILGYFPDLNHYWLLTGVGETEKEEGNNLIVSESKTTYGKQKKTSNLLEENNKLLKENNAFLRQENENLKKEIEELKSVKKITVNY